jgi:16S rRNA U1498 N3-methylase RsmE
MIILAISSFGVVILEPLFKSSCSAIDQIRLQKLRQLAFWAYQQSKSKTPQQIQGQLNLQAYYQNLYQQCMNEEQQLLGSIRFNSFKDYLNRQ